MSYTMPEFEAPTTFNPHKWGGTTPLQPRASLPPAQLLKMAQDKNTLALPVLPATKPVTHSAAPKKPAAVGTSELSLEQDPQGWAGLTSPAPAAPTVPAAGGITATRTTPSGPDLNQQMLRLQAGQSKDANGFSKGEFSAGEMDAINAGIRARANAGAPNSFSGSGGAPNPSVPGRSATEIYQNERKINQDYYDRRMSEEATSPADRTFHATRLDATKARDATQALANTQQATAKYGADAAAGSARYVADTGAGSARYGVDAQANLGFEKLKLDQSQGAGTAGQADTLNQLQRAIINAPSAAEQTRLMKLLQSLHPTKQTPPIAIPLGGSVYDNGVTYIPGANAKG